ASHPELAGLEEHLFGPGKGKGKTVSKVTLREAADRRSEVEAVVRQIVRLSRGGKDPLRYRDMAVIVRDLSAYDDLLAGSLAEQGIPFFIDRRYSLAHHGLVQVVRSALAVVEEDFSVQAVRALLKTGLLGIEQEQLDRLENYILAHGIKGTRSWWDDDWSFGGHMVLPGDAEDAEEGAEEDLAQINATRREMLERLGRWCEWAGGGSQKKTVKDWVGAIVELLEHLRVPEQLSSWADRAERQGRTELAQQHRRVWECLGELLGQMVAVLGEEQIGLGEFKDILEAGMADFTLGLVPPKLDQVLVGSVQRSRHPTLRAVFVIGMNEGVFPQSAGEDSVLSDRQR
ncbi:MAG: exodeoxyribonuclease V subunit gamma, partial [Phycisphaerae bacterium]|nr:exodeoxyribonuclease V subunit gamma [Phycisphaerae bacterium]